MFFSDPVNCPGCKADVDVQFWGKKRFDNRRLEKFFDQLDKTPLMDYEEGDREEEYRFPVIVSPFTRGGNATGKEVWTDILTCGDGVQHTCLIGRVPYHIEVPAFLSSRTQWVDKGEGGYGVVLKVCLFGMVDQSAEGIWFWNVAEKFFLPFPEGVQDVFGKGLVVDGYFELSGRKASRKKKRALLFKERVGGRLLSKVPKDLDLKVVWEERFIPAPCSGAILWAAFATVMDWCSRGKSFQKD